MVPFQELILLDDITWIQNENTIFTAFFLENPNTDLIFEDVGYTIYLFDASGNEISSSIYSVRWIFPSQTIGIVVNSFLSDDDPAVNSVSIEWEFRDIFKPDGFTYPFTVDDTIYWRTSILPSSRGASTTAT